MVDKKSIFAIFVLILLTVGGLYFYSRQSVSNNLTQTVPPAAKVLPSPQAESKKVENSTQFITHNPVDLNQIKRISKFRSCVGHDSVAENIDGEKEPNRSLKHYLDPVSSLSGKTKTVKVFAPFDGTIAFSVIEGGGRGQEVLLTSPKLPEGFYFSFFHIDLLPQFKENSDVKAGELLGYHNPGATYFDIALRKFADLKTGETFTKEQLMQKMEAGDAKTVDFKHIYNSFIYYLSPELLKEYQMRGITESLIIIPKKERDISPCRCQGGVIKPECDFDLAGESASQWVYLK